MTNILLYLTVAAMAVVFIILLMGVFSLFKGGQFSEKYGNRLMRYRVMMQGVALLLFVLFMVLH